MKTHKKSVNISSPHRQGKKGHFLYAYRNLKHGIMVRFNSYQKISRFANMSIENLSFCEHGIKTGVHYEKKDYKPLDITYVTVDVPI